MKMRYLLFLAESSVGVLMGALLPLGFALVLSFCASLMVLELALLMEQRCR